MKRPRVSITGSIFSRREIDKLGYYWRELKNQRGMAQINFKVQRFNNSWDSSDTFHLT